MDPASYEAYLMHRAFQYTVFFLLTYGSLQVVAFIFCKGWLRAVAALPLIVMVPIIIAGANPDSHRDGSLYGLVVYVPYASSSKFVTRERQKPSWKRTWRSRMPCLAGFRSMQRTAS
jgi:hypothetical protein